MKVVQIEAQLGRSPREVRDLMWAARARLQRTDAQPGAHADQAAAAPENSA